MPAEIIGNDITKVRADNRIEEDIKPVLRFFDKVVCSNMVKY